MDLTKPLTDNMLWLDLETTGSDVDHDEIIEVGCILTTSELEEISAFRTLVQPGHEALGRMVTNDIVRKMHTINGLYKAVTDDWSSLPRPHIATNNLLVWLNQSLGVPPDARAPMVVLAGSGVGHFDRKFIDRYMPQLSRRMRYWCVDIGNIRRAYQMWTGEVASYENDNKTHRALDDANCHLKEARAYRDLWRAVDGGKAAAE